MVQGGVHLALAVLKLIYTVTEVRNFQQNTVVLRRAIKLLLYNTLSS
jgi:hypothetical protein